MIRDYISSAGGYIYLGPFVSATDGKTPITNLTFVRSDIKVIKNGAISTVDIYSDTDAVVSLHLANGIYVVPVYATDLDILGKIEFSVAKTGALLVKKIYEVRNTYTPVLNITGSGTATLTPAAPIFDGENALITMTPLNGSWYMSAITVDGSDVDANVLPTPLGGGDGIRYFPLRNVAANHVVNITFIENI